MTALALALALCAAATPAQTGEKVRGPKKAVAVDRPVNVNADEVMVSGDALQATWKGNVVIERDDVTVTCEELVADLGEGRKPKRLSCQRNVHAVQKARPGGQEREFWCDLAVFETTTGALTLTGNPRAREGTNTFRAAKFTYFVDENRLKAEKPEAVMVTGSSADAPRPAGGPPPDGGNER